MASSLTPPGSVTRVAAERALVLAPHQDDELLGCGGLLQQLVQADAVVNVVFLSDGSGGVEKNDDTDPAEYAQIRRQEAEAVAQLGGWATSHLELGDGRLAQQADELQQAITTQLNEARPDLILVPGPLELTPDHRATFDALFEVLTTLRPGDPLYDVAAGCRVFTYSVNHPGYPNVLVDVSEQMDWVEQTMQLYASQVARHNYTAAAVGLRQFRSHSLPAEVSAAEGFTELRLDDFTTNSPSSLRRRLGAPALSEARVAEVPVSLIVRTFNRPQLLCEALESVQRGFCLPSEIVLVNDGGEAPRNDPAVAAVLDRFSVELIEVNLSSNRGRAAAANAGLAAATADYVAFLDDDDVFYPEHFQVLSSAVAAAGVEVAYSDAVVATYRLQGPVETDGRDGGGWVCVQRGLPYSRDFDPVRLLVDNYIPFHTLLTRREVALETGFNEELESFEDWDFTLRLAQRKALHHVRRATCEYRHFEGSQHHALGAASDRAPSFHEGKAKVLALHGALLEPLVLAEAITDLRRETVQREQEVQELRARWEADRLGRASAASEAASLSQRLALAEDRYHREHGEVVALRAEDQRLRAHAQELDQALAAAGDRQAATEASAQETAEHLERTYAEIERLMSLIDDMKSTRAWRLHELLHRRGKG